MKIYFEFSLILLVYFFGIICIVSSKTGDVILVNIIARHGARTPTWFYATDKNRNAAVFSVGAGVLTEKGKEQTFHLGLWLKSRYKHLLTSHDKVYAQTTDVSRVQDSARCILAGMFSSSSRVDCSTNIHPVVHSRNQDYVLGALAPCAAYQNEFERVYRSSEIEKKNSKFKKVYQTINAKSGCTGKCGDRMDFIHKIYDTVLVEKEFKLTPDSWAVDMMKPMKEAAILSFVIPTWTDKLKRLKTGPLIGKMIEDMQAKVNNRNHYNVMFYGAHDMTIVSFLNTLGKYDMKELPDYASFLLLELIDSGKGKHSVKLYYSQSTKPNPKQMLSKSLDSFIAETEHLVPHNWHSECNS